MNIELLNGKLLIEQQELPLQNHIVIKPIGEGANAKVFLVQNQILDRNEALKIWLPRKSYTKVDEKRFFAEIKKNAQFSDVDSIATIYTAHKWKDIYYCFMEYCPGITLQEYLNNNPSWLYRWGLARGISDTLENVYKRGFYHGDLHNKNIIVNIESKHNMLKILDFGTSTFSGKDTSRTRDAKMLFSLSLELLPCMKTLEFYNNKQISTLSSPLLNKAFRSVINISDPRLPPNIKYDFLTDPHPPLDSYLPPDYYEINTWKLVSLIATTPLFRLEYIDKFFKDFNYLSSIQSSFYQGLYKKIVGNDVLNDIVIKAATISAYEDYSKKYIKAEETKYLCSED